MFGFKERRERKALEGYILEQIGEAIREYDKNLPSRIFQVFRGKNRSFDWLALSPVVIQGVRHSVRAIAPSLMPADFCYQVAANVILDKFDDYFGRACAVTGGDDHSQKILSFELVRNDTIPDKIKEEVGRMRQRIRRTIFVVASYIEAQQFSSLSQALESGDMSNAGRRGILVDSHYRIRVSCKSIEVSLALFAKTAESFAARLARYQGKDGKLRRNQQRQSLVAAVFVYEMLDLICAFLRAFEIQGVAELRSLHEQVKSEIEIGRLKSRELTGRAHTLSAIGDVSADLRSAQERDKIWDRLESDWLKMMRTVDDIESGVGRYRDRVSLLELRRDGAAETIRVISVAELTSMVHETVNAVADIMNMKIPDLPPLRLDDVQRLVPA